MRLTIPFAPVFNFLVGSPLTSKLIKAALGFAAERSIPKLCRVTLEDWYRRNHQAVPVGNGRRVHLYCDEFTDVNDAEVGMATVTLLAALGYEVLLVRPAASGRAMISQGFLRKAKRLAEANVAFLREKVSDDAPLVGIEPSAISCFKDEYPDLVSPDLRESARALAGQSLMFEEFVAREMDAGRITPDAFTDAARNVRVHVHCHQKALSAADPVVRVLGLPRNYKVSEIKSGCCGMAGAFGYQKDHYAVSMKVAEQVLLPAVRASGAEDIIAASGTSCRHQIADGAGCRARHTAEVLWEALKR
jgi:Fe-S oxidoreductase